MRRSMPALSSSSCLVPLLLLAFALLATAAPVARSAEPDDAPPARPGTGASPASPASRPATRPVPPGLAGLRPGGGRPAIPSRPTARVVKVADRSIVIRPTTAPAAAAGAGKGAGAGRDAADAKPAADPASDQTLAIDKDRTRVVIETVIAERPGVRGQPIRMSRYERGEVADLDAGQFIHVIAQENGVATEIAIMADPDAPKPAPATIVKVDEKSITVQPARPGLPSQRPGPGANPAPAADGAPAGGAAGAGAPATTAPAERTYATDAETTRVTVEEVAGERTLANGQTVRSVRVRQGSLADLKAGQLVELRARGDAAVHIRVVPEPMRNADGTAR